MDLHLKILSGHSNLRLLMFLHSTLAILSPYERRQL
ncbi:MAG TPA: hypothetical protein [Caudoviricetes sp.]|nr:MAG TPA: hypothetical protein [Caudoviricetes sp.]